MHLVYFSYSWQFKIISLNQNQPIISYKFLVGSHAQSWTILLKFGAPELKKEATKDKAGAHLICFDIEFHQAPILQHIFMLYYLRCLYLSLILFY